MRDKRAAGLARWLGLLAVRSVARQAASKRSRWWRRFTSCRSSIRASGTGRFTIVEGLGVACGSGAHSFAPSSRRAEGAAEGSETAATGNQHDRSPQGFVSESRVELRLRRGPDDRWEDASLLDRDG